LRWPGDQIDLLVDVGLADDKRYIRTFHTFGMVSAEGDRWRLHHYVSVDWDEHSRLVISQAYVDVEDEWVDGPPGAIAHAEGFAHLIRKFELRPVFAWEFSEEIQANPDLREDALRTLGISTKEWSPAEWCTSSPGE